MVFMVSQRNQSSYDLREIDLPVNVQSEEISCTVSFDLEAGYPAYIIAREQSRRTRR